MFKRPLPKPLLLLEPPLYGSIKIIGSGECLDKFPALHAPIMVHVNHFHEAMQPSNASSSISGCCPDTLVDLTSSIPLPILPNPFHQGSMLTHEGCGLQFRFAESRCDRSPAARASIARHASSRFCHLDLDFRVDLSRRVGFKCLDLPIKLLLRRRLSADRASSSSF